MSHPTRPFFTAGIMILGIKPYRVGDWVEIQDKIGQIETILKQPIT